MNLLGQRPAFDAPDLLALKYATVVYSNPNPCTDPEYVNRYNRIDSLFRRGYLSNTEYRRSMKRLSRDFNL